ncbi:hypothetical protein SEUBUCD646_0B04230 [Saccharomyces eubayanus]|uniref:Inositol-pentakisphosphate 2-kinase n=2 Tax=Saccharomyces TaxID=4930 RepID=A0A6C1E3B5_SACPS|nr:Inositol-pentakisphosphate 2-kinase [Saccharomyces pastorianus]CAI1844186.1 hypothetical protein SEUBUCD650_0B04240 [Saccharomyces eubayanus]CAI1878432.1 hypothetical protein SEUBUCD646_0B04230 [Saccharomyces eubayanus]
MPAVKVIENDASSKNVVTMRIVGRGGANVLIEFGHPNWLWRCCVRWPHLLSANNAYTIDNIHYIKNNVEPLLHGLLCPMELIDVSTDILRPILDTFISELDDEVVKVIKIKNLASKVATNLIQNDHLLKSYCSQNFQTILLELKPKWIYYDTNYCRNCTHNALKGRKTEYCYNQLLMNSLHLETMLIDYERYPVEFKVTILEYLRNASNVFRVLYELQKKLSENAIPIKNLRSIRDIKDELLLLMTLRDVTCFIEWNNAGNTLSVHIVDVDLKPKKKWTHWTKTQRRIESGKKVLHTSNK